MKKKTAVVLIGLSMLASMGTGAYAATKLEEIKAYLNPEIQVKVDGTPVQLRDVNGNAIAPIMYKDANYFPIRAISDALGVAVDYDQESKTIILGEKVDGVSIADGFDSRYHTKDPNHTTYKGKDYKEAYFDNNVDATRGSSFMLYPNKEYQKLYLQIAAVGEDLEDIKIEDSDKDIILKRVEVLKVEDGLVTLEVDIGGVSTLFIHSDAQKGGSVFIPLTTSYYK
ncbi:hypothetical protein D3P08_18910 [Paenibacillus nanensis]|uniref:Copper amine oxidase-like N-terminal domain-containing protein n=1 Tax=Paenibacillus nanensis TaxID=393251 RepID=A0A3A1URA1_9BACL|nr:hypothetical protein [Paenibacillus nanensis]RIX50774.1 hypothetical protein D3P08_18910 [Paenibacillus nanensis]